MPLLSVYNNLILGHVHMHRSRFDSHLPSELKEIHHRIRKINSAQPLYKMEFDEESQRYAVMIKENAMDLQASLLELTDRSGTGAFSGKILTSSNPRDVLVEATDGMDFSDVEPLEVEVFSLPTPQTNEGKLVNAYEKGISAGTYTFTSNVEGDIYSFRFNASGENTNEQLQNKLADFINKTKVGIRGRVVKDHLRSMSRLELFSKSNGVGFVFEDVDIPEGAKYGLVEYFGLNEVTCKGTSLSFSVNGTMLETNKEEYITKNGIKLHFKDITDEPVIISQVTDENKVVSKMQEFVRKYNNLSDCVREGSESRKASRKLYFDLNKFLMGFSKELSDNGLEIADPRMGGLEIDEENLHKAITEGTLENSFSKESDIAKTLMQKLSNVSINPMDYIDKIIIIYPNIKDKKSYNPYISSMYSGIMYNSYC